MNSDQNLNLVRKKELALENVEAVIDDHQRVIERHSAVPENEKPRPDKSLGIEDHDKNLDQPPCEKDFIEQYTSIYVSPIYEDKRLYNGMNRTQMAEGSSWVPYRSFNERRGDNEKDLEIRRLQAELQRRRLQDIETERNTIADKFIDKINTTRTPTISRVTSYHEGQLHKADQHTGINIREGGEIPGVSFHRQEAWPASYTSEVPNSESTGRSFAPNGFLKVMRQKIVAGKRGFNTPNVDRFVRAPDTSKSDDEVHRTSVSSFLASMQDSVENLWNGFKICDSRESDSSKINSGAIEDELFILKKTICKLAEMFKDYGEHSFPFENGKEYLDVEKLGDVQGAQLAESDFKVISIDSSSIMKERKLENTESTIQASFRETEALLSEKGESTSTVCNMHKKMEKQQHRIEELEVLNKELFNSSQAKEHQLTTEAEGLRRQIQQVLDENERLSQELAGRHKSVKLLKEQQKALRSRNSTLKLKLTATEDELRKQEEALERITSQLGTSIMGTDDSRADEQVDVAFKYADTNQQQGDVQLRQAQIFVADLEEKILCMDAEVSKAIKEMLVI